jgi:Protein of unknown function (DUF2846)
MTGARAISIRTISIGFLLFWPLVTAAAAAPSSGMKAKPPAAAGGHATIYFLRPSGFLNLAKFTSPPAISFDGHKIGELPTGAYFIANLAAGHHTLGAKGSFLDGGRDTEIDLTAGQTYFLEIGTRQTGAPGQDLANMLVSGVRGRELPGHGFLGDIAFYQIDAEHGRAEIATLKKLSW